MSYILDALRKSEKERRRGEVPHVLSQQDAPYPIRKRRSLWPYVILGPIVINIVVLLWVFNPFQQKTLPAPAVQTAPVPDAKAPETRRPEPETGGKITQEPRGSVLIPPAATARTPAGERKKAETLPAAPARRSAQATAESQAPPVSPPSQTQPAKQETPEEKAAPDIPPPVPHKVYTLAELPQGLKQKLPALSLSLTVHSDDRASRLATINGQTVREGQTLPGGVRVEEILPDSAILTFQGYRFSVYMR